MLKKTLNKVGHLKSSYRAVLFVTLSILIFSSCYTQTIEINEDGLSGTVSYKLTINDAFYNFFSYLGDRQEIIRTFVTSLTNLQQFRKIVNKTKGATFLEQKTKINKGGRQSNDKIAFSTTDSIPNEFNSFFKTSIVTDNLKNTCVMTISLKPISGKQSLNQEYLNLPDTEKELIDKYAKIVTLNFTIETPKPIIMAAKGSISNARKKVEYNYTLYDILNSADDIKILVTYNK